MRVGSAAEPTPERNGNAEPSPIASGETVYGCDCCRNLAMGLPIVLGISDTKPPLERDDTLPVDVRDFGLLPVIGDDGLLVLAQRRHIRMQRAPVPRAGALQIKNTEIIISTAE